MTTHNFRTASGGHIDRAQPLSFTFDGKRYTGYAGDTLASALMANGVRLMGRSFKYHRPRGLFGSGFEEPNAMVQLRTGDRTEPNIQATRIELYDGLIADSQNRWPSLRFDAGALTGMVSKLFPAGFYYKTFMWPASLWMTYEHVIRNIAGMGKSPTERDPDRYAQRYAHCDVLVCGAGPAGISAALTAAESGARVILIDDAPTLGGALLSTRHTVGSEPGAVWALAQEQILRARDNVTVLTRTQAAGYYDHNTMIAVERLADHLAEPDAHTPRQRLWRIRATEIVLATGSMERPLVFAGNDKPNVMLASAAQALANRFGVKAGHRAVVFTNNGSAYGAARDMANAGIEIAALVDARTDIPADELAIAKDAGIGVIKGHVVLAADGSKHGVKRVHIGPTPSDSSLEHIPASRVIDCDLVAVSGGWTPSVHLFSQSRGKLRFDAVKSCFVPNKSFQRERSAGACNGDFRLKDCLADGISTGADAARAAGFEISKKAFTIASDEPDVQPFELWALPLPDGHHDKRFVDLQNDVTADDIALAHREGFRSVEHLKRYTTLGMGTDQGRSSNVNGLALMAGHRGEDIPSRFRRSRSALSPGPRLICTWRRCVAPPCTTGTKPPAHRSCRRGHGCGRKPIPARARACATPTCARPATCVTTSASVMSQHSVKSTCRAKTQASS